MKLREWIWPRRAPTVPAVKTSAAGPLIAWSQAGQPRWTPRRYDKMAEEGYRKNVVVHRCVGMIAQAVAQMPWLLFDAEGQEHDRHPLLTLLARPNPLCDGQQLRESLMAHLLLSGNAYVEAIRPFPHQAPRELYILRPDRMKVVPGPTGLPLAYQYQVGEQLTRWDMDPLSGDGPILHLRNFHPLDDWYGLAPAEAALLAVDQHNAAGAWNQALLSNGARPSGALVFAPKEGSPHLSEAQVQRLKDQLDEQYQGPRQAGKPLLLEGGLDWKPMSHSPLDMDWRGGRDGAARDIALAFGVPAQMIGIPDAQSYANMQEARLAFYEETALPLAQKLIAAFNRWLLPMSGFDGRLDIDLDAIPALAARRDVVWDKLQRVDFLTINEKRIAAGYAPLADGDVMTNAARTTKEET